MATPDAREVIEEIAQQGVEVLFAFGLFKMVPEEGSGLKPKVDASGQVRVGTFTREDEEQFKKFFKIKL